MIDYNLLERVHEDASRLGATVVAEQVDEKHVRVLAERRDASVLIDRLLKDPACGPRAEKFYKNFLSEISA